MALAGEKIVLSILSYNSTFGTPNAKYSGYKIFEERIKIIKNFISKFESIVRKYAVLCNIVKKKMGRIKWFFFTEDTWIFFE